MDKKIISTEQGVVLENGLGSRLEVFEKDGLYGLGTFFYKGTKVGATIPTFLREDTHYVWDEYKANRYEIIENTVERGVITFFGSLNKYESKTNWMNNIESNWLVTITLTSHDYAYKINVQVGQYLWGARYHPLYVALPFDHDGLECISYPLESPILPPYEGVWYVTPDIGKVPFLLAREKRNGKEIHVGIGYTLDHKQDYTQGRLMYSTLEKGQCLRVYFPYCYYPIPASKTASAVFDVDLTDSALFAKMAETFSGYFKGKDPYEMDMVVSIAGTQADCVFSYRDKCGFTTDTEIRGDIMGCAEEVLKGYGTVAPGSYVEGMGYRMRGWSNSDDKANYYDFINFADNMSLAVMLYDYWHHNRKEEWARKRAFEIADFYVKMQQPNGAIGRAWNVDESVFHGIGENYAPEGVVFCPLTAGASAKNLDILYELRKKYENVEVPAWKESARKAIDWLVHLVEKEKGFIKGTYNLEDVGVMCGIEMHGLQGLRYFYNVTKNEKYHKAMVLYEKHLYNHFAVNNDWYNGILDSNNFHGPINAVQNKNYYTLNALDVGQYFLDRYMDTGDEKFLQWANDNFAFGWMGRMPVNMPGYTHLTKGIAEEQNIWVFYDLPWPFNSSSGLIKMARLTEDPFYANYYKVLIHTQIGFGHFGEQHPFFSQVLNTYVDKRAPMDTYAELSNGRYGVWVTGYTTMWLADMIASHMYFYIGGKDWGVGMDYNLNFDPNFKGAPYLRACTTRINAAGWNKNIFTAELTGKAKENCELIFKWDKAAYPVGNLRTKINGKEVKLQNLYDDKQGELIFYYDQMDKPMQLEIAC